MLLLFGCLDNVDFCFLNQRNNVLYCINDVLVCSIRHHDNTSETWRQKQQERNKTNKDWAEFCQTFDSFHPISVLKNVICATVTRLELTVSIWKQGVWSQLFHYTVLGQLATTHLNSPPLGSTRFRSFSITIECHLDVEGGVIVASWPQSP